MASDLEFLSKKRRVASSSASKLGYSALAGEKRPGVPKAPTTIANVTLRKWTPNGTVVASVAKYAPPPKYCPGDREQLIRRLATFQELTDWTPKPERVGEIEWAKRGWVCKGKERVKCTLCHKELVVGLNRKEVDGKEISVLIASDISEALVDKYVELMVTSHREECLWRKRGCDGKQTWSLLAALVSLGPTLTLDRFSAATSFAESPGNSCKLEAAVRRATRAPGLSAL